MGLGHPLHGGSDFGSPVGVSYIICGANLHFRVLLRIIYVFLIFYLQTNVSSLQRVNKVY